MDSSSARAAESSVAVIWDARGSGESCAPAGSNGCRRKAKTIRDQLPAVASSRGEVPEKSIVALLMQQPPDLRRKSASLRLKRRPLPLHDVADTARMSEF